jgi:predicted permease
MGLKRIPEFPKSSGHVLNLFVIYISLPALVLREIPKLAFSQDVIVSVVMAWGLLVVCAGLVMLLASIFKWNRATTGCLLLLIPLGNTSFLGIPIVSSFFGADAVPYALIYDQFGTFLALSTYGTIVVAIFGNDGHPLAPGLIIKRVIFFPPFIALIFAIATRMLSYPSLLLKLLDFLSATMAPLAMVAVGFLLTLRLNRTTMGHLGLGLLIKLVLAPLMAWSICQAFGLAGSAVKVAVFQAGMPPMVTAGAMAISAKLSPDLAAGLAGIGIVFSFATLPLLYQFLI